MDVEPTAEVINKAAVRLRDAAQALERTASKMRLHKDITYASEAMSEITNLFGSLRLDLLVTRPIREFQKHEIIDEPK